MTKRIAFKPAARSSKNGKATRRAKETASVGGQPGKAVRGKAVASGLERARGQSGPGKVGAIAVKSGGPAATLKERVEQAINQSEPLPTAVESDAVRFAISMPGLLEAVREEAFVKLAGIVERKLAKHGRHLTRSEAANVAWWVVGHPDDVPEA